MDGSGLEIVLQLIPSMNALLATKYLAGKYCLLFEASIIIASLLTTESSRLSNRGHDVGRSNFARSRGILYMAVGFRFDEGCFPAQPLRHDGGLNVHQL